MRRPARRYAEAGGTKDIARSASAVMVNAGFTPGWAEPQTQMALEHEEEDHRPLRPVVDEIGAKEAERMADQRHELVQEPQRRALARHVWRHQQAAATAIGLGAALGPI